MDSPFNFIIASNYWCFQESIDEEVKKRLFTFSAESLVES